MRDEKQIIDRIKLLQEKHQTIQQLIDEETKDSGCLTPYLQELYEDNDWFEATISALEWALGESDITPEIDEDTPPTN